MSQRRIRSNRRLTPIERLDIEVAGTVALDDRRGAGKTVSAFAELGDQPPLVALSLGIAAAGALRRDARLVQTGLRMLAAHSLSTMGKLLGKGLLDRTRPEDTIQQKRVYRLQEGGSEDGELRSMPSGHSAGATAVTIAAVQDYRHLTAPVAAAAGAVMLAQLPSKNHFLTDVLAGAAVGLVAGGISLLLIPPQTD